MPGLRTLVAEAAARPVPDGMAAMAAYLRGRFPDAVAVLGYGSALRGEKVDDTLIDLYLLTASNGGVSDNPLSRFGCRLLPPNVYYAETVQGGRTLRAKYAVLPLDAFGKRMKPEAANPYFWARFAQTPALLWWRDDAARDAVFSALEQALTTMHANAGGDWVQGFRETYRTELRSEGPDRAREIVAANAGFYAKASELLTGAPALRPNWPRRRAAGKFMSVLRLIKAAFTFQGGADYAAWKIEKHSGVRIEVTDWQRRHPVLAGLMLLPKLLKKGALR